MQNSLIFSINPLPTLSIVRKNLSPQYLMSAQFSAMLAESNDSRNMQIHQTAKTFQFTEIIFINDSKYLWNLQITMRPYAMGFFVSKLAWIF